MVAGVALTHTSLRHPLLFIYMNTHLEIRPQWALVSCHYTVHFKISTEYGYLDSAVWLYMAVC